MNAQARPTRRSSPLLLTAALTGLLVPALPAAGQASSAAVVNDAVRDAVMYGVRGDTAELFRYDFNAGELHRVGPIRGRLGTTYTDIGASAYVPGFRNLFAFPQDERAGSPRMVYVRLETGEAIPVGDLMEGGRIAGATAADTPAGWRVFGVQLAKVTPPFTVAGSANLNPNNSSNMEFTLRAANGTTYTRDDLHSARSLPSSGTFFEGAVAMVRFRPKGNGNQNSLMIDGEPYDLQNSNTYTLVGDIQLRVYNTKVKNGRGMGHWWMQITSGTARWEDDVEVETPDRLVRIDHKTGTVNEIMPLSRSYAALATADGQTFYATSGQSLYRLDAVAETETRVATLEDRGIEALEYCNGVLMGFTRESDRLVPVDPMTGHRLAIPAALGCADLTTLTFWSEPTLFLARLQGFD